MTDQRVYVAQDTLDAAGENTWMAQKANKLGFQVQMDFYTQMAIEGRVYQVRAGTISVPLVGDADITDTKAELCADAPLGTTIIPVFCNISYNLAAATLFEAAGKSVATASSGGAAFVPLNLKSGAYITTYDWEPTAPPFLVGPRCFYVQVAGDTTGPSHFSHFDYIELPSVNIS
jgi:hypothetical protein